jgi:hypothetical protein
MKEKSDEELLSSQNKVKLMNNRSVKVLKTIQRGTLTPLAKDRDRDIESSQEAKPRQRLLKLLQQDEDQRVALDREIQDRSNHIFNN